MKQLESNDHNESTLDLKAYINLLWSWAWLILLTGVLAGAVAFFVSKRMTPAYEATARLLVNAPSTISGVDPSTGMLSMQTLTSTYSEMLQDQSVLDAVIKQLNLPTAPSISVKIPVDTQLLEVTAEDADAKRAADIANAMVTVFAARIQDLRSQRYASIREGLVTQVNEMEQQIASTSGQISAIKQELADAASQRAAVIGTQLAIAATQTVTAMGPKYGAAATQTLTAVKEQIAVAGTQTAAAAPATVEPAALVQLEERLTQYRTLYSNLVLSYEQVRLAEEQTSSNVVVSELAQANTVPVRPKTAQNTLLAVVVGMMVAVGAVLAGEKLDDTIRDPAEVQRTFGLPVLGVIARHNVRQDGPVTLADPLSAVAEAFRSLRTNILHATPDRPLRRILITSSAPQDGKTMLACSLAVVLSQNDKRILLLDADLRKPQVHHWFGLQNRTGLSGLFSGPLDNIGRVIRPVKGTALAVLTSGAIPPNPAELLASHLMEKILDRLNQDFDLIVIDTPPLLTVTDAPALAPLVDGVVMVAKPGKTSKAELRQALRLLDAVHARVLGVVLNDVNPSSRRYGYYYRHYSSKYSQYYAKGSRSLVRLFRSGGPSKKYDKATPRLPRGVKPKHQAGSKKHAVTSPAQLAAVAIEQEVAPALLEVAAVESGAIVHDAQAAATVPEAAVSESEATGADGLDN